MRTRVWRLFILVALALGGISTAIAQGGESYWGDQGGSDTQAIDPGEGDGGGYGSCTAIVGGQGVPGHVEKYDCQMKEELNWVCTLGEWVCVATTAICVQRTQSGWCVVWQYACTEWVQQQSCGYEKTYREVCQYRCVPN